MSWQRPTNLREWMSLVLRHKKKAFFPAIGVMILTVWISDYIPRQYQAEGKFRRVLDAATMQLGKNANMSNLMSLRRQLEEDITGRPAVEQLINDLQLTRDLPHTSDGQLTKEGQSAQLDMTMKMRLKLRVKFQIQSDSVDLVVVSYNDSNRELSSKVVNQAIENYIRKTRLQLDDALIKARDFFQKEVADYTRKIDELEQKKLQFVIDNPGLAPEDPASLKTRITELRGKLDATNQQLQIAQQKREQLTQWIKTQPENLENRQRGQNPKITDLNTRKQELEKTLESNRSLGRREEHPQVKKLRQLIADIDVQITQLTPEVDVNTQVVPNTARITAQQELTMLEGEAQGLEKQRDELVAQVERMDSMDRNFFVKRNEYNRMERELDEAQRAQKMWDENLRSTITSLTAELGQRGVRLFFDERAPELARASSPTFPQILTWTLAAGLGVGVLVIVLAELMDGSFHSVDQAVDGLKLPVLGVVNQIVTPVQEQKRRVFDWAVYPSLAVVCLLILTVALTLTYLKLEDPFQYDDLMRPVHQVLGS